MYRDKGQVRIPALLIKALTLKADKKDSVDKISSKLRAINDRIGRIRPEVKMHDTLIGLLIISIFYSQSKFGTVIYHLLNDNNLTSKKVVTDLKIIKQNAVDFPQRDKQQQQ